MCVSTGNAGSSNAWTITTLAVLCPTPGSSSSAAMSRGGASVVASGAGAGGGSCASRSVSAWLIGRVRSQRQRGLGRDRGGPRRRMVGEIVVDPGARRQRRAQDDLAGLERGDRVAVD